jgi:hypothetical protein
MAAIKLYTQEHHNLHSSPDIISVIRSKRIKWAGNVAHVKNIKIHNKFNPVLKIRAVLRSNLIQCVLSAEHFFGSNLSFP